jgi:glutamate synthase domain-containing protein 3
MKINAQDMYYKELNDIVAKSEDKNVILDNVCGQRYIGSALWDYNITINGTPGNALACYMNNSTVVVNGNAQDALGDTMNLGRVIVHGQCGDTCGYAMRGGEIYIRDHTGYRTGIHMKEYGDMKPSIVVGGKTGDFLGEYLAGGVILVLGLDIKGVPVGAHCGTGMHGGVIYIRTEEIPKGLPSQVNVEPLNDSDIEIIRDHVTNYCNYFGGNVELIMNSNFIKLKANSKNPYRQLYTKN